MKKLVMYGLYPFLLAATAAIVILTLRMGWDAKKVYGIYTASLVLSLIALERLFPLEQRWAMTGKSFLRDLRYIAMDAPTIALTKSAFGWVAIAYSQRHVGPLSAVAWPAALIAYLLAFEFFQYGFHRYAHTGEGPLGRFLWRIHVAHHLPDRVYVVMHAVFHPLNAFITASIIQIPLILLGVPPAAAFAASLLIDLQSLISHFNVDLRLGPLNYVFIGPEAHRFHHAADLRESGNFGNTLAIWDLLFGTFRYRPGVVPQRLGVADAELYPPSEKALAVLVFPIAPITGRVG